jgi:inner membrane protein
MSDMPRDFARSLRTPGFKLFLIGALILVLFIPLILVSDLVAERESRAASVRAEVASLWGGEQLITGPVLIVPYTVVYVSTQGDKRVEEVVERRAVFMPDTLSVKGNAASKVLHRSIFELPVYVSALSFQGHFAAPQIADVVAAAQSVRWHDAVLAVAINDVSGLKATVNATINGNDEVPFDPSVGVPNMNVNGIHLKLANAKSMAGADAAPLQAFDFRFDLKLNGSSELSFAPVARETAVELTSDWPHPSFAGAFLPLERSVSKDGFTARWQVPHLARSVPQAWSLHEANLERIRPFQFGVRFFVPVDFYQLTYRATKYAIMFLAAAYMAVFTLELRATRPVHPVQYFFVGFAIVFFYVLLLSIAEHLGFTLAYVISACATGGMLSVYVARVQESVLKGCIMFLVFIVLYGFLYMILLLEDYALITGAVIGFILLTVAMFSTLKVNWSGPARTAA